MGFRIEEFGENDFLVKGVPTWLGSSDVNELVNGLIDVILDTGLRTDPAKFREEMFKTMACKAAVKETQPMRTGGDTKPPHGTRSGRLAGSMPAWPPTGQIFTE